MRGCVGAWVRAWVHGCAGVCACVCAHVCALPGSRAPHHASPWWAHDVKRTQSCTKETPYSWHHPALVATTFQGTRGLSVARVTCTTAPCRRARCTARATRPVRGTPVTPGVPSLPTLRRTAGAARHRVLCRACRGPTWGVRACGEAYTHPSKETTSNCSAPLLVCGGELTSPRKLHLIAVRCFLGGLVCFRGGTRWHQSGQPRVARAVRLIGLRSRTEA